jgi:hypothetical protein
VDLAGLAALITSLSTLLIMWRKSRGDDEARKEREQHDRRLRSELVILGQNLAALRADNASLAMLVNQLFNQYEAATGKKPDVDFDMLRNLQTLQYVTGKLGPLDLSTYHEPNQ